MGTIRIVADSTCDLSAELKDKFNITTIPLCIVMEDQTYFDGESITPDQIYLWSDANKLTPKTAAVPYDRAAEVLEPLMKNGDEIIFFGISEQMSTTCNIIRLIASDYNYDKLHIIDSMSRDTDPVRCPVGNGGQIRFGDHRTGGEQTQQSTCQLRCRDTDLSGQRRSL